MSACVSPPHDSVSHIVQVAAIIAHAASTALPPFWKIIAPAVAASGLPVIASHLRACRGGLFVAPMQIAPTAITPTANAAVRQTLAPRDVVMKPPPLAGSLRGCYPAESRIPSRPGVPYEDLP